MKSLRRSFRDYASKKGSWKVILSFWIRRVWRILPSAWLWLILFAGVSYFFSATGAMGDFHINVQDSIAGFLQYANFHTYQCAHRLASCGPNGIYWSLSLEEQFYILLPLTILIFKRYFIFALIVALLPQLFFERPEWSFGWAFRFDTLIWGVLLALWTEHPTYLKFQPYFLKFKPIKWILIPILLFGMAYIPKDTNQFPLATTLLGTNVLLLVYLASYDKDYLISSGPLRKILLWFGSRSYSLYLIHIFAFRFAYEILYQFLTTERIITSTDAPIIIAIAFLLLFLISELNYRYVETPFRKYGIKKALVFIR